MDYLQTAAMVKARIEELRHQLKHHPYGKEMLQRRIAMLEKVELDTREIGCYLRDYYKR